MTDFLSFLTRSISAGSFAAKVSLRVCAVIISKHSILSSEESGPTFAIAATIFEVVKREGKGSNENTEQNE